MTARVANEQADEQALLSKVSDEGAVKIGDVEKSVGEASLATIESEWGEENAPGLPVSLESCPAYPQDCGVFHEGFTCSAAAGCQCNFKCKPKIQRLIACTAKTASVVYDALRNALCGIMPSDCIWMSPQAGASFLTAEKIQAGPAVKGADVRLLVSIRDPFQWLISSYLFYGLRGQEYGCRIDLGESIYTRKALVSLQQGPSSIFKKFPHVPTWADGETYSHYLSQLTVRDGLLIDMLRQIDAAQVEAGFPKYTDASKMKFEGPTDFSMMLKGASLALANSDGKVRAVCVDKLTASTEQYDKIMQESVEFFDVPAVNGSTAWALVGEQIRDLEIIRNRDLHPMYHHNSALSPETKAWLGHLAVQIDAQYFGGFVAHYAKLLACRDLPAEAPRPPGMTDSSVGKDVMKQDGGGCRRLQAT
jgi:hypothetical protein